VKHLIKAAKIDTASKEFTEISEHYATDSIRGIPTEYPTRPGAAAGAVFERHGRPATLE
jgi:hypothetical protein